MTATHDVLFRTLADPTRRALFERLCRDGEQTVTALTAQAGISQPAVDHRFQLRGDWGSVDCRVLVVEPNKSLSYTWDAMGLESVVTWTLTPTGTGTMLRMEQAGFRPDQQQAYQGAKYGWQKFLASLEQVVAKE